MRIIDTAGARAAISRPRSAAARRVANVEALGLLAASLVMLFGLCLTTWTRLGAAEQAGRPVHLRTLSSAADLLPVLTMATTPAERQAIAERVYRRATDVTAPIDHVGALAGITVSEAEIKADRRLVQARARLAGREGAGTVRLLSAADLAALKPHVIVRTPDEYTSRLRSSMVAFFAVFWIEK